jgi:acetyltransferase
MVHHYLTHLFKPRSVAVFGASERPHAVGTILFNGLLKGGFQGPVYAINPKYRRVQGTPAFSSLGATQSPVDVAVIATPAPTVAGIMDDLGQHGTRAAVVISAGFREVGEKGRVLEEQVVRRARPYGIRLVGPNCIGIARPEIGFNATLSERHAQPGHLALVSQSGALCTAILDWAEANAVGFSSVISTGNSADIDFGEILDYLISDARTRSILLYIEGIYGARRFMSALRAAARVKPVIVMKSGRHMEGSRAVLSHTGALVGDDEVFDAAMSRAGVVRVHSFADLFEAARTLSSGLRARGNRLAMVTNGGGTGVMAADRLVDKGLPVPKLSASTIAALDHTLPSVWSHDNPVDIMGDAPPERFREAIASCLADLEIDAILVILTPQAMTQPERVAQEVISLAKGTDKPILTCWMGEGQVDTSRQLFSHHHVPSYATPEAAVDAFHLLVAYYRNQQLLLQAPEPLAQELRPDLPQASNVVRSTLKEGRRVLQRGEAEKVLAAFHISTSQSRRALSVREALKVAEEMGFPIVMRIDASESSSRADAGGERRYVCNAYDLQSNYYRLRASIRLRYPETKVGPVVIEPLRQRRFGREFSIQASRDPVFGPAISLGSSHRVTDVVTDRAMALPPLNAYLARSLIQNTRAYPSLAAFHHLPGANMERLEEALLRISEMVCELPELIALSINPIIVDEEGANVAGMQMVVAPQEAGVEPYAHMTIHPYPAHLRRHFRTHDGIECILRPIRPEDAKIEQAFVHGLSSRSKYFRFMSALEELTPAMLSRFTQIDYDREMALIAVTEVQGVEQEIGVARYITNPDGESCEFAIVVADEWQGKGIATQLMRVLRERAREKGLTLMTGEVLRENQGMLKLMRTLGFQIRGHPEARELCTVAQTL